jgi:hypothetical protein
MHAQAQQRGTELAGFQWLNEHLLLRVLRIDDFGHAPAVALDANFAHAAALDPLIAGWSVRSHRHQLRRRFQGAADALGALAVEVKRWEEEAAQVRGSVWCWRFCV